MPTISIRCVRRFIGALGETYKGIGKDLINIESLPVFADAGGAFGSPTSDSERAMIRAGSQRILMDIFSFAGSAELDRWMARTAGLLQRHCGAKARESAIVAAIRPHDRLFSLQFAFPLTPPPKVICGPRHMTYAGSLAQREESDSGWTSSLARIVGIGQLNRETLKSQRRALYVN